MLQFVILTKAASIPAGQTRGGDRFLLNWLFRRRRLDQLFDELKRIAAEDRDYHSRTVLTEEDHHAYVSRQTRRRDILHRIAELNLRNQGQSGRSYSFFMG